MTKRVIRLSVLALAMPALWCSAASAELKVAAVFADDMVLQRNRPVVVWGMAEPGRKVTVAFASRFASAVADDAGRWRATLTPMHASAKPGDLTIQVGHETMTIQRVLVGDVWLCIDVHKTLLKRYRGPHGERDRAYVSKDAASASPPIIRAMSMRDKPAPYPVDDYRAADERARGWRVYDPKRARGFEGTGEYYLGRACWQALKVPIGVIRCDTSDMAALTPPEGFATVASLKDIYDEVATWNPLTPSGKAAYQKALRADRAWVAKFKPQLMSDANVAVTQPPRIPGPPPGEVAPTTVYNEEFYRFVPYTLAGVFFEPHNATSPRDKRYADKLKALVLGLRSVFGQDLPVCVLQTRCPVWYEVNEKKGEPSAAFWTALRELQTSAATIPNTYVVGTYDFQQPARDPFCWGTRMAQFAIAEARHAAVRCGPIMKGFEIRAGAVRVTFENVGSGLTAGLWTPDKGLVEGGTLKGFAVEGTDGKWHDATATIDGDAVVIRSAAAADPTAARYAWVRDPEGSLYNKDGFPALPFGTDVRLGRVFR